MILVDTSVLIDHLRGNRTAWQSFLGAIEAGKTIRCSVVSKVEILAGMRPAELRITRSLLDSLEWLPVTDDLAEDAGRLANQYLPSHPGVDSADYVIAATALQQGATLWTRNVKHFPMFEGLEPPY